MLRWRVCVPRIDSGAQQESTRLHDTRSGPVATCVRIRWTRRRLTLICPWVSSALI
jgi:hypothetical protein